MDIDRRRYQKTAPGDIGERAPAFRPARRSMVRARILDAVERSPGIPVSELIKAMGIGWGSLYHHLGALTKADKLRVVSLGRRRLVYALPGAASAPEEPDGLDLFLRGATARAVATEVARSPGRSAREISERTGLAHRVVYYHLRRLSLAGLVATRPAGAARAYHPTDDLERLL